ncbi:hypothetical protein H0H92_016140 [Tricholoma furcatifolium]|nr:hypothetical protein H0H92_016140 [Tricholoma furcatifolium]
MTKIAARASIRSEIEEVDAPTQPQTKKHHIQESGIEGEPCSKLRKASMPSGSSGSRAPPPASPVPSMLPAAPPSMPNAAILENLLKQWAIEKNLILQEQKCVQQSQVTSISCVAYNNTTSEVE